ncbi:hypothetical protein [Chelatococcus asaccharovorans]|uniref:hypothetical protein n=1 Tax=Chelatococcus asaccharovorans TaxID=28210 RepID=UPI0011B3DF72|nr:hypothetical protein [Chelatococcus asaccharovorans]MBS7704752.1 hypothetical protein [Chelatococcus asaccharovorans]
MGVEGEAREQLNAALRQSAWREDRQIFDTHVDLFKETGDTASIEVKVSDGADHCLAPISQVNDINYLRSSIEASTVLRYQPFRQLNQ